MIKSMRAEFKGDDPGLAAAADAITALTDRADFWDGIVAHGPFDRATISANEIAQRLRAETHAIRVVLWKPRAPRREFYKNTVAVTNPKEPFVLHYHVAFLGNSIGQKINTIVHEFIHNVDDHDGQPGEQMGHGDNDWHGKENTAPYWIGEFAQRLYEAAHPAALARPCPPAPVEADVFADEACDNAYTGSPDPEV
ncbi:MAG: hypothetical protein NVS3B27_13340 [Novosphingobium sp.]